MFGLAISLARALLSEESVFGLRGTTMTIVAEILDVISLAARLMFSSPLWTPAASVAVGVEVVWLASSLAFLLWLARRARFKALPQKPPRRSRVEAGASQNQLRLAA